MEVLNLLIDELLRPTVPESFLRYLLLTGLILAATIVFAWALAGIAFKRWPPFHDDLIDSFTRVRLAWAWGFLASGATLTGFIFWIWHKRSYESLGALVPHWIALLLCLSFVVGNYLQIKSEIRR